MVVRSLRAVQPISCAATVAKLELLLADARSGQLVGFAAGAIYRDKSMGRIWSVGDASLSEILGALSFIQHGVLGAMIVETSGK